MIRLSLVGPALGAMVRKARSTDRARDRIEGRGVAIARGRPDVAILTRFGGNEKRPLTAAL